MWEYILLIIILFIIPIIIIYLATRDECQKNDDCKDGKICEENFCVPSTTKEEKEKKGKCVKGCRSSEECIDEYCYAKEECGNDSDCEGGEYDRKCRDKECTGKFSENCKDTPPGFKCYNDNTIDSKYMIDRKRGTCVTDDDCAPSYETCDTEENTCYSNKHDIDSRIAECQKRTDCNAVACDANNANCELYKKTKDKTARFGATTYIKNIS